MTTYYKREVKCKCCGKDFMTKVIGSTSEIGYRDLDTRPSSPKRYALEFFIHKCPNCGYVLQNFELDSDLIEYIKSDEYQTSENMNFSDEVADSYYKNALIGIQIKNSKNAALSFLKAAWACDDAELSDEAIHCRKRFLDCFDEIPKINSGKTLELMRIDVLRRAGEFDKLLEECDLNNFDEDIMVKIAEFEISKAKERDAECYNVGDVID